MKKYTKALIFLVWIAGAKVAVAAVPGALESFPTSEHAESWSVFDYADDTTYYPQWGNDADPFLYFYHVADAALWFFTDQTGSGDWLGDYEAADIQSIQVEVFIDSLEHFGELDCVVLTNGPAGWQYYSSASFFDTDFPEFGWWELTFDFATTWYYYDEGWVSVEMKPEDFQEVEDIGFRFFPKPGTTAETFAAIDTVRLEPRVEAPELAVANTADDFQLRFTPLEANTCFVEQLSGGSAGVWKKLPGQTGISGPAEHMFSTPLSAGRGIFRVGAEAEYAQVTVN